MDTTTIIAICGIAATCIFGGLALWLARRRRYPGQITYFQESSIGLFDSIVRNLDALSVIYKDEPVSENIVLVKGYIMNTGTKDITPGMIEEPLALKLPEGFRWLDAKVVSSSTSVKAKLDIKDITSAEFDVGLFRVSEHVQFEALAEVPATESHAGADQKESAVRKLKKALTVAHRIADTQKTIAGKLPSPQSFKEFITGFVFMPIFGLALIGFVGFSVLTKGAFGHKELHFLVETESADTVETKIDVARDGMLIVEGVDTALEWRQSATDFFAGCNCKPKVVERSSSPFFIYPISLFLGVFGLLALIAAVSGWQEYKNTRKVRRLLSLE